MANFRYAANFRFLTLMSTRKPMSLKLQGVFSLFPDYDSDLSQNLITFSFCQILPSKKHFRKTAVGSLFLTLKKKTKWTYLNTKPPGGENKHHVLVVPFPLKFTILSNHFSGHDLVLPGQYNLLKYCGDIFKTAISLINENN